MKKYFYILLCLIVLTGCQGKKEDKLSSTYHYNNDFYTIKTPYKKSKSENYIIYNNLVSFDVEEVEKGLIQLSTNEFSIDKYLLQDGQFLTKNDLIELLDKNHLNNYGTVKIDGKKVTPTIISGIVEKDFYDKDENLKGISLGLILNRYQSIDNNGNYVTMNEEDIINHVKNNSNTLINYLREDKKLDDIKLLIGLYIENGPNSNVKGNYLYYGVTNDSNITYNNINNKRYYMNNSKVKEMNEDIYNNYIKFEKEIKNFDKSMSVSGLAYYYDNNLNKIDIIVTKNNYNYGELLYFTQLTSDNVIKYFNNINVSVEINSVNNKKAYIVKQERESKTDIFIY